jgi:hypothetical protein
MGLVEARLRPAKRDFGEAKEVKKWKSTNDVTKRFGRGKKSRGRI